MLVFRFFELKISIQKLNFRSSEKICFLIKIRSKIEKFNEISLINMMRKPLSDPVSQLAQIEAPLLVHAVPVAGLPLTQLQTLAWHWLLPSK